MRISHSVSCTYSLQAIGCRLNQCELEAVGSRLESLGLREVAFGERSDLCVINTCTVTSRADADARKVLRRARRASPSGFVVVTGCFATTSPEEVGSLGVADLVVDNRDKDRLVQRLAETLGFRRAAAGKAPILASLQHHTRAMVKIQDGCQEACTYCVIPRARGGETSRSPQSIVSEIRALAEAGFKEVVLTGVHVGKYRHDAWRLPELLHEVLRRTPLEQIRLSSLEPRELRPRLVDLIRNEARLCPHLHVPLQSGHDEILRRMRRSYDTAFVQRLFEQLAGQRTGMALGTDVIVGFPGESDLHFRATSEFLQSLPLAYLHVFSYSDRPGTAASGWADKVPARTVRERSRVLRQLGARMRRRYYEGYVGRTLPVLLEKRRDSVTGRLVGLSGNYLRVHLDGPEEWMNRILSVRIVRLENDIALAQAA